MMIKNLFIIIIIAKKIINEMENKEEFNKITLKKLYLLNN